MADPDVAQMKPRRVRARSLALSFIFTVPVCYACTQQPLSTPFSLIVPPVGLLIVLVLANWPLRRFAPKLALSQADLIVIFGLTSIAAAMGSEFSFVGQSAIHQFPLQQDSALVREKFLVHLPDWLIVHDKALVEDMQGGGKGMAYVFSKLPVFFPRYCAWILLLSSFCLSMFCINSLMRQVWCHKERLTFPLIQLPVALSEKGGGGLIWRNKALWIAFAVMFSIDMLNGINFLYPNVPFVPTKLLIDVGALFKEQPWVSLGYVPIAIFPFMAAIGIFMPNDMLISVIFFYLLRKATHVILASQGFPQGLFSGTFAAPGPPYFDEQSWGAIIALFVTSMIFAKTHLKQVWIDVWKGTKPEDGGLTHRWAFIGLIVSFLIAMSFGLIGGLSTTFMFVYVGSYLVFSIVLTRIRAQIGPPTHEFAFFGPNSLMTRFLGMKWISDKQATWLNQSYVVMNRIHRNHPMPYQLEAMKMGALNRLNQKTIFISGVLVTVFALFVSYFFLDVRAYRLGDYAYWNIAEHYLHVMTTNKKGPDLVGITMTLFGFAMVMILDSIRFKFPAFPLHPAGYVLALNYGVDFYWFGLLLALIIKSFIQRYYGLRGYDKLRMVAFGILIGEYSAELIWMTMALITNQSTYTISLAERDLGRQ